MTKIKPPAIHKAGLAQMKKNSLPFYRLRSILGYDYMIYYFLLGGRMAVDYLINAGHKKITGIFKYDDMQGHKRYQGFQEGIYNAGITICEENLMWFATDDSKIFDGGYQAETLKKLRGNLLKYTIRTSQFTNCTQI